MCGGGIGKIFRKATKVVKSVVDEATGLVGKVLGQDEPERPQITSAAPTLQDQQAKADSAVKAAEDKAAGLAREKSLKRRKAVAKGGRASTLLAGRKASADKKDKLGG